MTIVHLAASPFVGGPERQMLGLAAALRDTHRTVFLSYAERGLARPFLDRARELGFEAHALAYNAPEYLASIREVAGYLRRLGAKVLLCHGYKPDLLGGRAARRAGVPVVAVSHGWTGATWKVRLNDALDKVSLHAMDHVVCVSEGQARKVRAVGVRRVTAIRNAVQIERFEAAAVDVRALFSVRPRRVVGAAGRLSPEKGFGVLLEAAARVPDAEVGFAVFGDGPLRASLERRAAELGLGSRVVFAGFRDDLDRLVSGLDVLALSSFTEGLPSVVLEAAAAGVPVVATAVGGTPEAVVDGVTGMLVPPGDPGALARALTSVLADEPRRVAMGAAGREMIRERFTFEAQAAAYRRLFASL
ncbi:MAG: glycosyltransferase [Labilithrix sp.]|nr:glycosyltransferase [Labilithrix sp.]MCW5814168.1 glycosyltransferase [Labilithrix sp.]